MNDWVEEGEAPREGFMVSTTDKFSAIAIDGEGPPPAPPSAAPSTPAAAPAAPAVAKAGKGGKGGGGGGKAKGAASDGAKGEGKAGAAASAADPEGRAVPGGGGGTARRDHLQSFEAPAQELWEQLKVFQAEAEFLEDGTPKPKFMVTFPYPYMNGKLHLGHAYSLTKAEFMVQFQRMQGKNALFPFAFHCTGMPIQAAAGRLRTEMTKYGNPPKFPSEEEQEAEAQAAAKSKAAQSGSEVKVADKSKGKKAKLVAKTGTSYQWDIMKQMVPESDIPAFQDPMKWLEFFPPLGKQDMKKFGSGVDWRRSFITTSANPFYDRFIRWQFNTLKKRDKIRFGKRANVYSTVDGQVCLDHDRASGEGVGPQEYTIVKLRVTSLDKHDKLKAALEGRNVFLAPATLRPETMYGQTNCFVLPEGKYGAYEMADDDVLIMSARAARGMAHQDLTKKWGESCCLLDGILGSDLLGLPLKAPNATYDVVYTLPLLTISMGKGTGVVTSVPSDAPDDYAALLELKEKPLYREKFGLTDEMVMPFEVVPIIDIPGYGTASAQFMCDKLKIKSCKDTEKLKAAKEEVYLKGFYEGVMVVGEHKGLKVCDAKPLIRAEMIKAGTAFGYYEPESQVISRSRDECIVALTDQWYIPYGEDNWRESVVKHVNSDSFETYNPAALDAFNLTLGWLKEWACTRLFGLGTKLPWDEQWVIESLSDSTIYMAYYTIAHLLHGENNMDGSKPRPVDVSPDMMTDAVWDYIFLRGPAPEDSSIALPLLDKMRTEFEYWYPMDLRCSAKDLIGNHLTMALYSHAAIWEERPELWPRGYWTNGHVLVDSEKMSKSKGNFLMLEGCVAKFGADATRFALADAGDSMEDANFAISVANSAILKLWKEEEWMALTLVEAKEGKLGEGSPTAFVEQAFLNQLKVLVLKTKDNFSRMLWRDGLQTGFNLLQIARDFYRDWCTRSNVLPLKDLMLLFIEVQTLLISPICPHYAEHMWKLLGKEGSVLQAAWPDLGEPDVRLTRSSDFLQRALSIAFKVQSKGKPDQKKAHFFIATEYPAWKVDVLHFLQGLLGADGKLPSNITQHMKEWCKEGKFAKKDAQQKMQFASFTKLECDAIGADALDVSIPIDQEAILKQNLEYITKALSLDEVKVYDVDAEDAPDTLKRKENASPGNPALVLLS